MTKAAAEFVCACGHTLDAHERPTGLREPWGRCRAILTSGEASGSRCDCSEAWPVEDES